jgi:predicted unusual protein kinase regulating ubiquinone biosynthesis (AarF/ABC1/UbiB family)
VSSRPDLLPDVYIEELGKLVDECRRFRSRPFAAFELDFTEL